MILTQAQYTLLPATLRAISVYFLSSGCVSSFCMSNNCNNDPGTTTQYIHKVTDDNDYNIYSSSNTTVSKDGYKEKAVYKQH